MAGAAAVGEAPAHHPHPPSRPPRLRRCSQAEEAALLSEAWTLDRPTPVAAAPQPRDGRDVGSDVTRLLDAKLFAPPPLWYLEGHAYDLAPFLAQHPGGAAWLRLSAGRDVTELFHSHHLRIRKARRRLEDDGAVERLGARERRRR